MGVEHTEVVEKDVDSNLKAHEAIMNKMSAIVSKVATWTKVGFTPSADEYVAYLKEIRDSDKTLVEILDALRTVHNAGVKATTNSSRMTSLRIRQLTKGNPLQSQGFPATVVTWYGECVLNLDGDGVNPVVKHTKSSDGILSNVAF